MKDNWMTLELKTGNHPGGDIPWKWIFNNYCKWPWMMTKFAADGKERREREESEGKGKWLS
jgi:hypothetical protein